MSKNSVKGALLGSATALTVLAAGLAPKAAHAVPTPTLSGFCYGTSTCAKNLDPSIDATNQHTYTTADPPNFGFYASNGPITGQLRIDILVPDIKAATANFTISGSQGGVANNLAIGPTLASLVKSIPWSSGNLADYLDTETSTNNPIGAYKSAMAGLNVSATKFWVYSADLGTNTLQTAVNELKGPLLTVNALPAGSFLVGFFAGIGRGDWYATGNSGAILETSGSATFTSGGFDTSAPIPEPASLLLMAGGILGLGTLRRWRR